MNLKNITVTVRLDTKEVEQDFRKLARQFTDIADSIKKDREKEGYKAGTDGAELEADGDVTIYPIGERQYSINKELLYFGTTKDQHGIHKSSDASIL
jgi:hypothetical protein